jgi:ferredoxin
MPKIKVDKNKCIGCGACVSICSNFVMSGDKSKIKKPVVNKITCEREAAEACPVDAIKIEE